MRHTVRVELGRRSYDVTIGAGVQSEVVSLLGQPSSVLVISDANVAPLYAERLVGWFASAGWNARLASQPAGEVAKSLREIEKLYDALIDMKADRQTIVVAVGGGVVGDAAGFAAASYARGLPFVQVPTTLLAAVDSSVGGKVGVNHPAAKNIIGAFHQPRAVFIDTDTLATLPSREFSAGMAEVVKYGMILDAEFFEWLERNIAGVMERNPDHVAHIIERSCQLKAHVVERDEYETTGLRAVLNFGHTFGHAYEALSNYGTLLHGEAVSIGMVDAALLARELGRIPEEVVSRLEALLKACHLPTKLPAEMSLDAKQVIETMRLDKKSVAGKLRFILPTKIGHVESVKDVPEEMVLKILSRHG
jgi:3-dehydroquinate synthase